MLNNKAEYILQYITNTGKTILKNDIDWSQSRVFFVSPKYTKYQLESINFRDLPIYLYRIKKYKGNIIDLELITANDTSASINTVSSNEIKSQVNEEVKVYTEKEHLEKSSDRILEIYHEIKDEILDFGDNIEIKGTKLYVAFTVNNHNFCDIIPQKNQLKLFINLKKGELDDPKDLMRDISNIGAWGNGDYEIAIKNKNNIYDILSLIKQSYDIKIQ
jgi:predicted transport protein